MAPEFDLYGEIRTLAQALRTEGFDEWSARLIEVRDTAFTGTELLLSVRSVIADMLVLQSNLPVGVRGTAQKMKSRLDDIYQETKR